MRKTRIAVQLAAGMTICLSGIASAQSDRERADVKVAALTSLAATVRGNSSQMLYLSVGAAVDPGAQTRFTKAIGATDQKVPLAYGCTSEGTCVELPSGVTVVSISEPKISGEKAEVTVRAMRRGMRPSGAAFVGGTSYVVRLQKHGGSWRSVGARVIAS